jgi:hypothetical protein
MSRDEPPEPTDFDRLLAWLDPDKDKAAEILLEIQLKLESIFARRRECFHPEELASEVIDRVARKLPEVEATYTGDKRVYFYGFVRYVYQEYIDKNRPIPPPPPLPDPPDPVKFYCMEECMKKLTPDERQFLQRYYAYEGKRKIEERKALAEELEITLITLRTRAHRLMTSVRKCAKDCVKKHEGKEFE